MSKSFLPESLSFLNGFDNLILARKGPDFDYMSRSLPRGRCQSKARMRSHWLKWPVLAIAAALLSLGACTPAQLSYGSVIPGSEPTWVNPTSFRTRDGFDLHVRRWRMGADSEPQAVLIVLHGTNDHSGRFERPAKVWSDRGLLVYAYDQRGFGVTASQDLWPGAQVLVQDLLDFSELVTKSHPDKPITLLGESMGGAVVLAALANPDLPSAIERAVIVAPAVEGRESLGAVKSAALGLIAHTIPYFTYPTESRIERLSDDETLIKEVLQDVNVRKTVRMDALWGLTNLMDMAVEAAPRVQLPVLVVYGGRDKLVSVSSVHKVLSTMPSDKVETCYRPNSGHFLLHETLTADENQLPANPKPLWNAVATWQLIGKIEKFCELGARLEG